jgi:hypothetical protein
MDNIQYVRETNNRDWSNFHAEKPTAETINLQPHADHGFPDAKLEGDV